MDPTSRGSEEYGYGDERHDDRRPEGARHDGERYAIERYAGEGHSGDGTRHARPDGERRDSRSRDSQSPDGERPGASAASQYTDSQHADSQYTDSQRAADPERPPRVVIVPGVTPATLPANTPPITPALAHIKGAGPSTPPLARTLQLISGDLLLTVNPVDGSEIELCPPGRRPPAPVRRTAEERADLQRAGRPPVPAGPAAPALPLLERRQERERLTGLLGRGRSVLLTGAPGSGRTSLFDAVAADCADLAPDGVVRLSGHHRTTTELLYELYATVHRSPLRRPDRAALLELVRDIGAVVFLDDLELGGQALDELLAATPECAYLIAATPDADVTSEEASLEEVVLRGLGRGASLDLLERAVERPLTDEEANWAGDLWFESEGLPLRFVQAGALLRQRDRLRAGSEASDEFEPFERPVGETAFTTPDGYDIPLPSLGEGAAPAALLASRLSEAARATLRFAVALGGEVPHQAHLPALVGDTHADAALGELTSSGLLTPVGPRYRLAPGVAAQLEAHGYADDAVAHAHTAAQHYAWWTGHPSVTPERAAAEADAILASMGALLPGRESGHPSAAVLLARSAAPAFLAGLHWGAWERALRSGSEAARLAGEVAEEAYFHHELGVLALCVGNLDRARAELEASIGMRGAVADKSGTVAGRRALALVIDRESALSGGPASPSTAVALAAEASTVRYEAQARSAPLALPAPRTVPGPLALPGPSHTGAGAGHVPNSRTASAESAPLVARHDTPASYPTRVSAAVPAKHGRRTVLGGARRNLVAASAGVALAAVLGTVVTLGTTSGTDNAPGDKIRTEQSTDPDDDTPGLPAEQPVDDSSSAPGGLPVPGTSGSPSPSDSVSPSDSASPSGTPSDSASSPDDDSSAPNTPSDTPTDPPSSPDPTSPSGTPTSPSSPPTSPTDEPTTEPTEESEPPPSSPNTTASDTSPSVSTGATGSDPGAA
ncbi:ATP-binding protein [Streptomyces sp. NPDC088116]|uniref:ATP-binding protein n=1 Tax=Streptomyces sp. NPDC088116 TaxID=3365825 RepID=UPI00380AC046